MLAAAELGRANLLVLLLALVRARRLRVRKWALSGVASGIPRSWPDPKGERLGGAEAWPAISLGCAQPKVRNWAYPESRQRFRALAVIQKVREWAVQSLPSHILRLHTAEGETLGGAKGEIPERRISLLDLSPTDRHACSRKHAEDRRHHHLR